MIKIHCQKLIKRQGEDFHSTSQPHSSVLLCALQGLLYKRFTCIMRLIYDSLVFCIHKNGGTLSRAFFFFCNSSLHLIHKSTQIWCTPGTAAILIKSSSRNVVHWNTGFNVHIHKGLANEINRAFGWLDLEDKGIFNMHLLK